MILGGSAAPHKSQPGEAEGDDGESGGFGYCQHDPPPFPAPFPAPGVMLGPVL